MSGKRFDISLNLVCKRLNWCLCDNKCSFVSIAMLIWSFTIEFDLTRETKHGEMKLNATQRSLALAETPQSIIRLALTHANGNFPSNTCRAGSTLINSTCVMWKPRFRTHVTIPHALFEYYDWHGFSWIPVCSPVGSNDATIEKVNNIPKYTVTNESHHI